MKNSYISLTRHNLHSQYNISLVIQTVRWRFYCDNLDELPFDSEWEMSYEQSSSHSHVILGNAYEKLSILGMKMGQAITRVPGASGFFAQGDSLEEARGNLRDAIEGNVILALQLGFEIPHLEGIEIKKRDVQTSTS